jgi:hypothetical protein
MPYIFVFLYRYTNHIYVSHTARTNYWDECKLPLIIRMSTIFGKHFSLSENRQDWHIVMISHMHVHKEDELWKPLNPMKVITERKLKINQI